MGKKLSKLMIKAHKNNEKPLNVCLSMPFPSFSHHFSGTKNHQKSPELTRMRSDIRRLLQPGQRDSRRHG